MTCRSESRIRNPLPAMHVVYQATSAGSPLAIVPHSGTQWRMLERNPSGSRSPAFTWLFEAQRRRLMMRALHSLS